MRILIVHPFLTYYGGAELVIVKLARYLKEKGHHVRILTLSVSDEMRKEFDAPIFSSEKNFDSGFLGIIRQINTLNTNIKRIEDSFDIINIHNFPAELALREIKTPSVWYCNEPPTFWLNPDAKFQIPHKILLWYEKRFVRQCIKKACVADRYNAERFMRRYKIEPEIVPYGVDYEFFSKGDAKKANELYKLWDKFVVLQVGTLTPYKNQMRSIQAIERLRDKIPEIRLILAGKGNNSYDKQLEEYIRKKKLPVILLGNIKREILRDLYAVSDILIHPVKPQGGWLAPFECLCTGTPVIVSPEFSASEIIKKEGLGFVTDNYEDAIISLYKNGCEKNKEGKMFVKKNLTWERFGERMEEIFKEVTK